MARYGRQYGAHDRQFGQRGASYGRRYGSEYDRADSRRGYDGGWGMTNLYNTIMHGGPRGPERYGAHFYHRPSNARYGWEDYGTRQGSGHGRGRGGRSSADQGSVGVHYRGRYDRF
jgi:hypothetical protein